MQRTTVSFGKEICNFFKHDSFQADYSGCLDGNPYENIVVCLIRAGMVFAMPFLEFGKFLLKKETSEETLQHQWKKQNKTSQYKLKFTNSRQKKAAVPKTKKGHVKKSSKAVIKAVSRISKHFMILDKLETKINYSGDEFQSEKIVSTASKGLSPVDDISHENVEIRSEITHESGHTVDSQETISGNKMHSEFYENETPENFDCAELQRPSTKFYLESRKSDVYSSFSHVFWNLASQLSIP